MYNLLRVCVNWLKDDDKCWKCWKGVKSCLGAFIENAAWSFLIYNKKYVCSTTREKPGRVASIRYGTNINCIETENENRKWIALIVINCCYITLQKINLIWLSQTVYVLYHNLTMYKKKSKSKLNFCPISWKNNFVFKISYILTHNRVIIESDFNNIC